MALVRRFAPRALSRALSTGSIKKSVFISQSKDIYTNLALEDWIYRNVDLHRHHVLMLWQNDPCVVVGRHQNAWLEANVPQLPAIGEGVALARRNSGGGAVFHDRGNLNLTFFTPRDHYNRRRNLETIKRALFRAYGLKLDISQREDLTLRDAKVSGTAAKLGRPSAYHHCTLLVSANKVDLSQALLKQDVGIETNATKSIRSKILNLCEENPKIKVDDLYKSVGWEYLRTLALEVKDGGLEFANLQNGFQMVNPTEEWFPGIDAIKSGLQSWDWCYGKSPKFTIARSFAVPERLARSGDLRVTMAVERGLIADVHLDVPPGLAANGFSGRVDVTTTLVGRRFSEEALAALEWSIGGLVSDKEKFVTDCVRQVMTSV